MTVKTDPWVCPRGKCEHAGLLHDWDGEPGTEMCCVDGCPCGKTMTDD